MTSTTPTPTTADVPERYRPLVARLDAVRPDCARAVRLAIERDSDRFDLDFLLDFVGRMERKHTAAADRSPVEPEPYTRAHLAGDLRASFRRRYDLLPVLEQYEGGRYAAQVLDIMPRLLARLAEWGYRPGDVRLSTPAPDGHQPPAHYVQATTDLVASAARLAKDVRDYTRAADAHARPLRVTRSVAQFRRARNGAHRLLDGQSYHLPPPPASAWTGDRRSWWVDLDHQDEGERFAIRRGRMLRTRADRASVLGPFGSRQRALDAGRRATATPDDMRVGLFADVPLDQLVTSRQ